jgi:peptidoglycan/LPS O-acetylase OafA/YrhL
MSKARTNTKLSSKEEVESASVGRGQNSRRYYRPELDAVRFLAFLLVLFHHVLPDGSDIRVTRYSHLARAIIDAIAKSGSYGLRLFFVLSAFLICELLVRERESAGTVRIGQFYIRRILRIWPLYYLGLALGLVIIFLPSGDLGDLRAMGWFAVFLGSWWITLHGSVANPMNVLWSISVEEQFYLLAPCLIKFSPRRILYLACGLLIAISNLRLFMVARGTPSDMSVWTDPLICFQPFAAGILVSLALHGRLPALGRLSRWSLILGAAICWSIATFVLHSRFLGLPYPGAWRILAGYALSDLGAVFILLGFLGIRPELIPRPVIYLGLISYGLYVFHDFAVTLVRRASIGHRLSMHISYYPLRAAVSGGLDLILAFGVVVGLASLSYRYFESIFLRMKRRHSVIQSGEAAAQVSPNSGEPVVVRTANGGGK